MIAPVITLFISPAQESVVGKKQWVQDPQGETWHEEGTSQLLGAPSSWGSHNPPLPPPRLLLHAADIFCMSSNLSPSLLPPCPPWSCRDSKVRSAVADLLSSLAHTYLHFGLFPT